MFKIHVLLELQADALGELHGEQLHLELQLLVYVAVDQRRGERGEHLSEDEAPVAADARRAEAHHASPHHPVEGEAEAQEAH